MGFVYKRDGLILRQVNERFAEQWDAFEGSELQRSLIADGMLIPHESVDTDRACTEDAYRVLMPEQLTFISYPYEWTFGQLKAAALLTLGIQRRALTSGFTLRDASAYNVQFRHGEPILIDSLSFEPYVEGSPWRAYRQFCEHFLGPLAMMAHTDVRLRQLQVEFLDGVPLDLAKRLLPWRARLRLGLGTHIFLHAGAQGRVPRGRSDEPVRSRLGKVRLEPLIESLRRTVEGLRWQPKGTQWVDYEELGSYSAAALAAKDRAITTVLTARGPSRVWDLGANAGRYSEIAADAGHDVLALDADPGAVERIYQAGRRAAQTKIMPLLIDLTNPPASIGWANDERRSLESRADAQLIIALALIHHLAIAKGVPLPLIAEWLARLGPELVIEFVPPEDARAAALLRDRIGQSNAYDRAAFIEAFGRYWMTDEEIPLPESARSIFVMRRR